MCVCVLDALSAFLHRTTPGDASDAEEVAVRGACVCVHVRERERDG